MTFPLSEPMVMVIVVVAIIIITVAAVTQLGT